VIFLLARTEQSEKFKTKSLIGNNRLAQSIKKYHVKKVLKKISQVIFKPTAVYFI